MTNRELPVLRVPIGEAEEQLTERIEKGIAIRDRKIVYPEDLEKARSEYQRWNTYNLDMLKRFFSTPAIPQEYRQVPFKPSDISLRPSPLAKRADDFKQGISRRIHKLESIRDRLPLFECKQGRSAMMTGDRARKGTVYVSLPPRDGDTELGNVFITVRLAALECGLEPLVPDDPPVNGVITHEVIKELASAELVIADLTHSSPNVYYQAGFAEARGNTPVYIARKGTRVPLDLEEHSVIFFENTEQLLSELETRLRELTNGKA